MPGHFSRGSAIIATIVSTLGTGILYMPSSFKLLGYVYGSIALVLMGVLTFFTLYALTYAAIMTECKQNASYPKVASLFSKPLKTVIDVAMISSNIGCCICILRFFCLNAATMLQMLGVKAELDLLRRLALGFVIAIVAYFGTKESLDSLAFISKISLTGVIYYLCLVSYYAFSFGHKLSSLDATSNNYGSGFIKVVFAMHCQFSFLSIFNQLEDKSLGSALVISGMSAFFITLIYASSGILGYIAVGNEIGPRHILEVMIDRNSEFMQGILKNSFDKKGILPGIALGLFIFIWFGFLCFATAPCIPIIQSYVAPKGKSISRAVVSILIALVLLIAGLPEHLNIGIILDVVAALFTNPLSFMFPSIFMICVTPRFSLKSIFSYILVAFSILIALSILKDLILG